MVGLLLTSYAVLAFTPVLAGAGLVIAPEWGVICPLVAVRGGRAGVWVAALTGLAVDALGGDRLGPSLILLALTTVALGAVLGACPRMRTLPLALGGAILVFIGQVALATLLRAVETGHLVTIPLQPARLEIWGLTAATALFVVWSLHRPHASVPFAVDRSLQNSNRRR
jgi:cell shape-determining protein MreD